MSWHFSRVLVEEYSAENSSAGLPFAPLSGSHTPALYCAPDRMKAFSRLFRFGITCEPLTADLGADVLTWCLEGSPVRTLAQQDEAQESTESAAECGRTWPESFATWNRATSSWKTPQYSLLEGLDEFSETWPRWGMMRDGECLEQTMSVRLTNETGCGLCPTPDTCAGGTGPSQMKRNQPRLQDAVKFATPCARDWKEQTLSMSLAKAHGNTEKSRQLPRQLSAECPELHGGQLNPTWVEWLMGWPLGWTDLKPSGTDKFQAWRHSHGTP